MSHTRLWDVVLRWVADLGQRCHTQHDTPESPIDKLDPPTRDSPIASQQGRYRQVRPTDHDPANNASGGRCYRQHGHRPQHCVFCVNYVLYWSSVFLVLNTLSTHGRTTKEQ